MRVPEAKIPSVDIFARSASYVGLEPGTRKTSDEALLSFGRSHRLLKYAPRVQCVDADKRWCVRPKAVLATWASGSFPLRLGDFFECRHDHPGHRVDPDKMIFDGLDPGDIFRGRADRPALPLIQQRARKTHDPVADHDIDETDRGPSLSLEFRINPLANRRIACRPWLRLGYDARQRMQEVRARYDTDKLTIAHHEYTIDLVAFHKVHDLIEPTVFLYRSPSAVITSPTLRPAVCRYSAARRPGPIRNSIQPQRLRCVPVSVRRTRSPSVTIPTRAPRASTTGKPLNLRSSINRMASVIEASGEIDTGSGVMTSAALMASPPHLNFAHI